MQSRITKTTCPLPWLHFSAHLDSTMRICCNTDGNGFVRDDQNKLLKLEDVDNIDSYFNMKYYKNIRQQMLAGEKPRECSKCFEVEHYGGQSVRQGYLNEYHNNEKWLSSLENTDMKTGEVKAEVQSLDFSLSNNCNVKCIMCSPAASYGIKQDYDSLGLRYSKEFVEGARKNWIENKAIDRLIPTISNDLRTFLTTGGEPFLSKEHFRTLELIVESGNASRVKLAYHTNCTVNNEKLFELWNHFESVSIHFSIDAFGELNEYIRHKTKWDDVAKNVSIMIQHPKTHCEIHTTVQVLNIFNLHELYDWSKDLKGIPKLPFHIWMDNPEWLKINILPKELKQEALMKIENYFLKTRMDDFQSRERMDQITSYLNRSIAEGQNKSDTKTFKSLIRKFESLRKTPPIESLVPELKSLLTSKSWFF